MVAESAQTEKLDSEPKRLAKSITTWSDEAYKGFREVRRDLLKSFAGPWYGGKPELNDKQLLNLLYLVGSIIRPHLFQSAKPSITTRLPRGRSFANKLAALATFMLNECKADDVFRPVVIDSLAGRGIVWTGLGDSPGRGMAEPTGFLADPGRPLTRQILEENFINDASAESDDGIQFRGHRFSVPFEWAFYSKLYDQAELERVHKAQVARDRKTETGELAKLAGQWRDRFVDEVRLAQVWLPHYGRLVTLPADMEDVQDAYLAEHEYVGPESGPYDVLTYIGMPGSNVPISPFSIYYDMAMVCNAILGTMKDNAKNEKDIVAVRPGSETDGRRVMVAPNGAVIAVDDPKAVNPMHFGGNAESAYRSLGLFMDLFNKMANNPESVGGLGAMAKTATQDQMLMGATQVGLNDKRAAVERFTSSVLTKILWYCWNDDANPISVELSENIGAGVEIPFRWDTAKREADLTDYMVTAKTFTAADDSPEARYRAVQDWLVNIIMPLAKLAGPEGLALDATGIAKMTGDLRGIEQADELFKPSVLPPADMAGAVGGMPMPGVSSTTNVYGGGRRAGGRDTMQLAERPESVATEQMIGA